MKRNLAIDIPDLLRRAEEILGIDAAVEMAMEQSAPIDHDAIDAAMRAQASKRAAMNAGQRRTRRKRCRDMETITWRRPRCPRCGCAALLKYKSVADQGDGSSLAWVTCCDEHCGHRFKLVYE